MLHLLLTHALSKEGKVQSCQQLRSGEKTSSEMFEETHSPCDVH